MGFASPARALSRFLTPLLLLFLALPVVRAQESDGAEKLYQRIREITGYPP